MMGQWFESLLEHELLELIKNKDKGSNKRIYVTNKGLIAGDLFEGVMINPCYSRLSRKMVTKEYVNEILNDCRAKTYCASIFPDD